MWVVVRSINLFVVVIQVLIICRMFLSFIIRDPYNPLYRVVYQLTEPILAPFRNLFDRLGIRTGMFDFSPVVALLAVQLLAGIIIYLLWLI